MNPIDIALRIATAAHAGQTDRDGYPVILHPLAVGLMGHTDEEKIAGFLHDVVEDGEGCHRKLLTSQPVSCSCGREYRGRHLCLRMLLFEIHDPAQTDGVGPDIGAQYRSCIFYRNEGQRQTAEHVMQILRDMGDEVNTMLLPEEPFYIGEAYHQRYYEKTGGEPYCHVRIRKF
ncbi:peptide-methionine (S)-S-oxide reductase [Prevotella sp.]|uniref:peptide-methionine (S)-S-oxide reductase n=1 Tax=Prevotella sp. TaxID=59823 RepID=UPI003F80356A